MIKDQGSGIRRTSRTLAFLRWRQSGLCRELCELGSLGSRERSGRLCLVIRRRLLLWCAFVHCFCYAGFVAVLFRSPLIGRYARTEQKEERAAHHASGERTV